MAFTDTKYDFDELKFDQRYNCFEYDFDELKFDQRYNCFEDALDNQGDLMKLSPESIEQLGTQP